MTTTVITKSRKVMVLIVVIIIGVFFNVLTSGAKNYASKKSVKKSGMYTHACAKLSKKHGRTKNFKVGTGKSPIWR